MLNRIPKLKIFQKVILVFLAIMIPVYLINLYINLLGTKFIKEETSKSMISNVEFYSKNLNDEIGRIKLQQWQLLDAKDLLKLSVSSQTMNIYDTVGLINNVIERINTVANSSNYISDISIYMESMNKIITARYGVLDASEERCQVLEKYYSKGIDTPIFYYEGKLFLIEPFLINKKNTKKDLTDTIFIELSVPEINKALDLLVTYKDSGAILVHKDLDFYISPNEDQISDALLKYLIDNSNDDEQKYKVSLLNDKKYWVMYEDIKFLDMKLISYVPENAITGTLKKYDTWILILSLASIASIFIFAFSINHMIHKPMIKFVNAFKSLEAENLDVSIQYSGNDEFSYLYKAFNKMVKRLKASIEEVYEQKIAAQQSELKQLQSQINPHFLYNSFFHIYRMCKCEDYENVEILTQKLGSYYQFITRSGADEVPIQMEFNHAKDYVDIQSMRFSNRINVEFGNLPEECKNLYVPRLILQPIIENAYEHGFENSVEGGTIFIDTSYEDNVLHITVEDDGIGMGDEDLLDLKRKLEDTNIAIEKTGIVNVSRRINLKYGSESGLFVSRSEYGGLMVDLIIKIKER